MRKFAVVVSLALLSAFLALPAGASRALSCGSPTHLNMTNGRYTTASTVQLAGNTFVQMDAWSPDSTLQQSMDVCSLREWNVTVTETDGSNPRVVDYPNSDDRVTTYDGSCKQAWSAYSKITSSWAMDAPAKGDWDQSYDFWMGDFGGCHQTNIPQIELMVYTNTHGNVFAPTAMANFSTPDGKNFDAWWSWRAHGSGCSAAAGCLYLQTRLTTYATSGTIQVRQLMRKLYGKGYTYLDTVTGQNRPLMPHLTQYADGQYGVEVVSGTNTVADGPIMFHLTNFSVTKK